MKKILVLLVLTTSAIIYSGCNDAKDPPDEHPPFTQVIKDSTIAVDSSAVKAIDYSINK